MCLCLFVVMFVCSVSHKKRQEKTQDAKLFTSPTSSYMSVFVLCFDLFGCLALSCLALSCLVIVLVIVFVLTLRGLYLRLGLGGISLRLGLGLGSCSWFLVLGS
jgi:hypothetical protein